MTGLKRLGTIAPIYRAVRTLARPPQTVRFPRRVPLSRLKGSTRTRCSYTCQSAALGALKEFFMAQKTARAT